MNIKITMAAAFFVSFFYSNSLFGDGGCPWVVYTVRDASTGSQSEAIVYFEDCNHMDVVGMLKGAKTYVKLKFPIPRQIIITGTEYTYIAPNWN